MISKIVFRSNVQAFWSSMTMLDQREKLNDHLGHVVWFTGLSGAGKSTLAQALALALQAMGVRTAVLDGDVIRQGLNRDLGFSDADRAENIRRVAMVAKLMSDAGLVVICAFISPFAQERDMARELVGRAHFLQIYVSTPLQACEARDPKGLYKKARAGSLSRFTGIGSPYEPPHQPDLTIDTTQTSVEGSIQQIIDQLRRIIGAHSPCMGVFLSPD
jgi:adenylyl-sulfate kinase